LNNLDLLVAQSFRQAAIYESLGVERSKLVVVPSTQKHIEHLKPKVMKHISEPINFVTLNGCNTKQKGAHLILQTMQRLHAMGLAEQFKLHILGYVADDVKDELSWLSNVVCKGTYTLQDLEGLLADTHVGIVPSIWEEVYGIVGIELLAKGIPVIGNNLGGIVDYTKENLTGWVNSDNTAEGLARIMAGIIADPGQIVRLNQSILDNHSRIVKTMKTHFDEMHDLYRNVLNGKQSARAAAVGAR
jgi:glycosyltransferase involved in cell wall biosynthesis